MQLFTKRVNNVSPGYFRRVRRRRGMLDHASPIDCERHARTFDNYLANCDGTTELLKFTSHARGCIDSFKSSVWLLFTRFLIRRSNAKLSFWRCEFSSGNIIPVKKASFCWTKANTDMRENDIIISLSTPSGFTRRKGGCYIFESLRYSYEIMSREFLLLYGWTCAMHSY